MNKELVYGAITGLQFHILFMHQRFRHYDLFSFRICFEIQDLCRRVHIRSVNYQSCTVILFYSKTYRAT
jgi:hypothetical protein